MADAPHLIGRLDLEVTVADLDFALALRPRIEALAWRLIPQVMQRVFDDLAPAGSHLRLARLDLDLGVVRPDHLEEDALAALESALAEAIARAVVTARQSPSDEARLITPAEVALERFETYLGSGVLPRVDAAEGFRPAEALLALAAEQPGALIGALRRLAGRRNALERLVAQAGEAGLRGLLDILTPGDATVIVALITDVALIQEVEPLVTHGRLEPPVLRRLLWVTTLTFLLRDPGSQFNRRRLLGALIEREARRHRLAPVDLLRLLSRALDRLRGRVQPRSSLPVTLAELVAESDLGPDETPTASPDAQADALDLVRRAAGRPDLLARVLESLGASARWRLLAALDPDGARDTAAGLRTLWHLHGVAPLLDLDGPRFEALAFRLVLAALAVPQGRRADRRAFWRHILEQAARSGDMTTAALGARLRLGLERLARPAVGSAAAEAWALFEAMAEGMADGDGREAIGSRGLIERFLRTGLPTFAGESLATFAEEEPAALADMVRRLARATPSATPALLERLLDWLLPEQLIEALAPEVAGSVTAWADGLAGGALAAWRPMLASLLVGEVPPPRSSDARRAGARLDQLAVLSHWLDRGATPWWAPGDAAAVAAGALTLSDPELVEQLAGGDPVITLTRLRRLAGALAPAQRARLLARLAPWAAVGDGPPEPVPTGVDEAARAEAKLRAAAAALDGEAMDLRLLATARPHARPPTPEAPANAEPPTRDVSDTARLLAWLDGAEATPSETSVLARLLARLADRGDATLLTHLAARRGEARARVRWAAILPPEALGRVVRLLTPARARLALDAMTLVAAAWRQIAPYGARRPAARDLWRLVLDRTAAPGGLEPVALVNGLIAEVAGKDLAAARKLRARTARLAGDGGYGGMSAALRRAAAAEMRSARRPPRSPDDRQKRGGPDKQDDTPPPDPGHAIYIANAGLILLSPYLPTLFGRLGLLTTVDGGASRVEGLETLSRGVHLLQYLADGRLDTAEPRLALNKLLCGAPLAAPILPEVEASQADLDICDGLLRAAIANWPMIGAASMGALRETFLMRDGRLLRGDARWTLRVQRKSLDVLVDHIPWSFALVYHRWMADPIEVIW